MEEKKNWKERLGGYDSMEEAMFVTIDEKTVYAIDELKEFIQQELDRARKEGMFTEDEVWTLSALVESKIDEIWDTMTLGTEKIVQEQSDDLHRLLDKLSNK